MDIIDYVAMGIILVMILLVLLKPKKQRADIFFIFSLVLLLGIYGIEQMDEETVVNYRVMALIGVLTGPVSYFYIKYLVSNEKIPFFYLHFVLPAAHALILAGAAYGVGDLNSRFNSILGDVQWFFVFISLVAYGFLMITYYQRISIKPGRISRQMARWILIFITVYMVLMLINFLYLFLSDDTDVFWLIEWADTLLSMGLVLTLAYYGYNYGIIYPSARRSKEAEEALYEKWVPFFEEVDQVIREEQLFLNPALRIVDISKKVVTNSRYISQAINVVYGDSVTNYLNDLRLTLFKDKLQDSFYQNLNIDALWMECGFNSKSSFNRFFKKREGVTPSEYRNRILQKTSRSN